MRRCLHKILHRQCKWIALFLLVRVELSGFLNPKLSIEGVFRRVSEQAFFALLELFGKEKLRVSDRYEGATIVFRDKLCVALDAHESRLSSTPRVEH